MKVSEMVQADASADHSSEKFNSASEWLPIETAPQDGTEVLAFMPGFGLGQMVLYWMDEYWREKANCMGLKCPPTHWMPLPAPPTASLNISNEPGSDGVRLSQPSNPSASTLAKEQEASNAS
jgi:hypothetical protein